MLLHRMSTPSSEKPGGQLFCVPPVFYNHDPHVGLYCNIPSSDVVYLRQTFRHLNISQAQMFRVKRHSWPFLKLFSAVFRWDGF